MFNRIRASIAGEPESPEKSPKPPQRNNHYQRNAPLTPPQQRQGFLGGVFSQSGAPANGGNNGSGSVNNRANTRGSFLGGSNTSAPPQDRGSGSGVGFFGSLLGGAVSPKPSPSVEASPGSIRASAAALLKLATPPPLTNSRAEIDHPDAHNDGSDNQRDTLENQINRRDQYISKLQHDLHKMQTQLGQYQKDSHTLRRQHLESTHRHGIAVKLWRRTNDGLKARVECFENETTPAAAREIANLIRDAAPPNKDSAYLMMLQDQLSKATVKLDHLGSQTEIVLHKGEEVVESLREEMNEVIRERCRMELELLDQEHMLEDDMRRMVLKTERRLRRVQGEIDFLEKNAVERLKSQESADGSESDDDEEGSDGYDSGDDEKKGVDGAMDDTQHVDNRAKKDDANETGEDAKGDNEDNDEGDEESSGGSSSSGSSEDSSANAEQSEKGNARDSSKEAAVANDNSNNNGKEEKQTPELLRKELRKIAMERDRTLSVLQKKLREKNDEYHALMRLREDRAKSIKRMEDEKRDREEWERSRGGGDGAGGDGMLP